MANERDFKEYSDAEKREVYEAYKLYQAAVLNDQLAAIADTHTDELESECRARFRVKLFEAMEHDLYRVSAMQRKFQVLVWRQFQADSQKKDPINANQPRAQLEGFEQIG